MISITSRAGMVALLVALCGVVGAVAGCSGGNSSASMSATSAASSAPGVGVSGSGASAPDRAAAPSKEVALHSGLVIPTAPSVIKTATLELRVGRNAMQRQVDAARRIAQAAGGYVQSSNQQSSQTRSATVVVRVPAGGFEAAVTELKQLGKVRSATEGGEDITRQLIDLNARLVNLQAQRRVLLGLMNKATTVAASILVENQLSQVQGEIEQLSGQLRYLNDRADFGTITLSMTTAVAPPPAPQHASALWQALTRSVDAAQSVVTAVIVGAGFVIPIALLIGLVAILARRFWPGLVAKSEASTPPSP